MSIIAVITAIIDIPYHHEIIYWHVISRWWPHGEYNQCSPIATIVAIGEHWLYSPCGHHLEMTCQ